MNILPLFSVPLAMVDLGRNLTKKEMKIILDQEQRENTGNKTSKNNYILELGELANLKNFFQQSINEYFNTVYVPKEKIQLRITQSWTNYTEPKQFHHRHSHPNSIISGVFYVQTDPTSDKIFFYKNIGWEQIKIDTENFNMYNSKSWWIEAITGRLLIFPSSLEHMVEVLPENSSTRISLSFNTFVSGILGSNDSLTELIL